MIVNSMSLFVSCPKGLQYALETELEKLGATKLKPVPAGVYCEADKACMYKILLWSRIANRVVLQLSSNKVSSVDDIYDAVQTIDWSSHFAPSNSFAVDFLGTNKFVNNSIFGALKVKDAIVDQFRSTCNERPSVNKESPDIRISVRLAKGQIHVGLDLSGDSLHKRGYRSVTGKAPLKENLAAGLLQICGWPEQYAEGYSFVDPMCGSGTILIEAAMSLYKRAPGMNKAVWGFSQWSQHDERLWQALLEQAKATFEEAKSSIKSNIVGFDEFGRVVSRAWENIEQAGFSEIIHVEKRPLGEFVVSERMVKGLLLTNPPYGERLGELELLKGLYHDLGRLFEEQLQGWRAGIFTGNTELGKQVGWRSDKQYKLYNGAIESQLLLFTLASENRFKNAWQVPAERIKDPSYWKISNESRADMLRNRLNKNLKLLSKWTERNDVTCYRAYDADMPEFSLAIDVYQTEDAERWLHVQEYMAPKKIDEKAALERLREGLAVLPEVFDVAPDRIVLKRRQVQKGTSQYEKESTDKEMMVVQENAVRLQVNLKDYLDTGLFLDHRPARRWIKKEAAGKRILNLFCYTGAVSAAAACGGAKRIVSVDMSKTYLAWAKQNLSLNDIALEPHDFIRADCMQWLVDEVKHHDFDLIFLDPPSFSNSKRMEGVLDVQRDHTFLIDQCMKRLKQDGVLFFSNNLRKFRLDDELTSRYEVKNLGKNSRDKDFERNYHIHHAWHIRHK